MGVFYLKYRDTRPILEVSLKDPDDTAHDLTGTTAYKLHIILKDGTALERDMVVEGALNLGVLRYTWVTTDWNAGNLVAGTHKMEYEVISGTNRLTFPNDDFDTLRIIGDIGQG